MFSRTMACIDNFNSRLPDPPGQRADLLVRWTEQVKAAHDPVYMPIRPCFCRLPDNIVSPAVGTTVKHHHPPLRVHRQALFMGKWIRQPCGTLFYVHPGLSAKRLQIPRLVRNQRNTRARLKVALHIDKPVLKFLQISFFYTDIAVNLLLPAEAVFPGALPQIHGGRPVFLKECLHPVRMIIMGMG